MPAILTHQAIMLLARERVRVLGGRADADLRPYYAARREQTRVVEEALWHGCLRGGGLRRLFHTHLYVFGRDGRGGTGQRHPGKPACPYTSAWR